MANISISDLRPAGADLFLDSESYLNDLTEQEMMGTLGGLALASEIPQNSYSCRSFMFCCRIIKEDKSKTTLVGIQRARQAYILIE